MDLIKLRVSRLENSATGTGAFLLHLIEEEAENPRILPIVIGAFEAQAILYGLEKHLSLPRPITHDLFYKVLSHLGYKMEKTVISKLEEGVFYATLYLTDGKQTYEFDSRTSDAVALAVRFGAPIYAAKKVMEEGGVLINQMRSGDEKKLEEEVQKVLDDMMKEDDAYVFELKGEILDKIKKLMKDIFGADFELTEGSKEDLEKMLQKAIENEDYELAAKIRDIIKEMDKDSGSTEKE